MALLETGRPKSAKSFLPDCSRQLGLVLLLVTKARFGKPVCLLMPLSQLLGPRISLRTSPCLAGEPFELMSPSKVWDTHTGECLHTLHHDHIVRAVAFPNIPRPQVLATGGQEKKLRVFDLSRASSNTSSPTSPDGMSNGNARSIPSYEIGPGVYNGTIKSIVWGTDLNILVTASDDKKIRWWDLRSRSPIRDYDVDGIVGSCELNALSDSGGGGGGGRRPVLSVAAGKSAYFFDAAEPGRLIKSIKTPYEIASVALHSGQRRFVTGANGDTWVRVYDFEDERQLDVHKGHHGSVWSVSFSPDGELYATGSEDGTIKLWKFCAQPYGLWRYTS